MFLSRRRLVLIGTVTVIAGAIVLLPLILTITLPDLSAVEISITKIELKELLTENNNTAVLDIIFNIRNPTEKSLTTSKIDYELFVDGNSLGKYEKSYMDIPVNGRPQLLSDVDTNNRGTNISSVIEVPIVNNDQFIIDLRNNNQSLHNIDWEVDGNAIIESGFSSSPKIFNSTW